MTIKLMTTQWTESTLDGSSNLMELMEYIIESDILLTEIGQGYARIEQVKSMVRTMKINRENKLKDDN